MVCFVLVNTAIDRQSIRASGIASGVTSDFIKPGISKITPGMKTGTHCSNANAHERNWRDR